MLLIWNMLLNTFYSVYFNKIWLYMLTDSFSLSGDLTRNQSITEGELKVDLQINKNSYHSKKSDEIATLRFKFKIYDTSTKMKIQKRFSWNSHLKNPSVNHLKYSDIKRKILVIFNCWTVWPLLIIMFQIV